MCNNAIDGNYIKAEVYFIKGKIKFILGYSLWSLNRYKDAILTYK